MTGKHGSNSNSIAVLLQAANTVLPDCSEARRCGNGPKRSGVKRIRLLPESPCDAKRLKSQYSPTLNCQDSKQNSHSYRNQQTLFNELPNPIQDKSLGNYLTNAVEEIKKLEDICRKKRHNILALKEKQGYLSRAQQYRMAARASCNKYNDNGTSESYSREFHRHNISNTNKNSTSDKGKIPDLLHPVESLGDHTSQADDVICISDEAEGNISDEAEDKNDDNQKNHLADQTRESITWFPDYVEVDGTSAAAEDHDIALQEFPPYNETLANNNSCMHVSVIKTQ